MNPPTHPSAVRVASQLFNRYVIVNDHMSLAAYPVTKEEVAAIIAAEHADLYAAVQEAKSVVEIILAQFDQAHGFYDIEHSPTAQAAIARAQAFLQLHAPRATGEKEGA